MNKIILSMFIGFFFVVNAAHAENNSSNSNNNIEINQINKSLQNVNLTEQEVFDLFNKEVKTVELTDEQKSIFEDKIKHSGIENKLTFDQYFVVADRNPKDQIVALGYWNNNSKSFSLAGFSKISTGSVRKEHFYTPVGWFQNLPENGSFRAQGTKNENGIRGYGKKGMRIWDFGWVPSSSGWKKGLNIDIRFQMHATDPDYLEQRLGRPDSKGCVRIHHTLNNFLDKYGIIDSEYEKINSWVLRKDRAVVPNAGSYLLVIDTADNKPIEKI